MRSLYTTTDVRAWIREAAAEAGYRMRALADALEISASHLSNFLAGRRELGERPSELLAAVLKLGAADRALLVDLLDDDPEAEDPHHAELRLRIQARRALAAEAEERASGRGELVSDPAAPGVLGDAPLRWTPALGARALEVIAARDGTARLLDQLVQGVPGSQLAELREALDVLPHRVRARCAELPPGARHVLVIRRWPLSRALARTPSVAAPRAEADYRSVLSAWMAVNPKIRTCGFIQRHLQRLLPPGERVSRATVHAIDRRRLHVPLSQAAAWIRLLDLDADAAAVFRAGVELAHARSVARRAALALRADGLDRFRLAAWLPYDERYGDRSWLRLALAELALHPAARADPAWIAAAVHPAISLEEAQEALQRLLEGGLLERSPDGGLHRPGEPTLRARTGKVDRIEAVALARGLLAQGDLAVGEGCAEHEAVTLILDHGAPGLEVAREEVRGALRQVQGCCDAALASGEAPEGVWAMVAMCWPD